MTEYSKKNRWYFKSQQVVALKKSTIYLVIQAMPNLWQHVINDVCGK